MKLWQTSLDGNFMQTIQQWADEIKSSKATALFHIYVPYDQDDIRKKVDKLRDVLKWKVPGIPVVGCTATGEILNGHIRDRDLVVTAMIFEDPTTQIKVFPHYEEKDKMDATALLDYLSSVPDLKGIEILTSAPYQNLESVGSVIDALPDDIEIFGGVAVGDEISPPFVFANDCGYSTDGSVFVTYQGPEFHIQTNRMFGWKSIGYPLKVTRVEGPVVYELDGKPAYDVYNHYLHIKKGPNFFYDALEFPWEVQVDEHTKYIRHAKSVDEDGSIVMSSNIPLGSDIRLTYGDPRRIMNHTRQTGLQVIDFAPQVVNIINCMGRKLFWADRENVEISEISTHLQTTGFSALGEIMRHKGTTILNNLSIVTVAMREGPKSEMISIDMDKIAQSGNIPITARLAIFINTITDELMEKNAQLNEMLYKASHDALTGLLNRGSIENNIYDTYGTPDKLSDTGWYLIMFDIDDFKQINDQYGHAQGDVTLKRMAEYLSDNVSTLEGVQAGRWGGEEFMILLSDYSVSEAKALAEDIRSKVKTSLDLERPISISVGVTRHIEGENVQDTITRVDELLYQAKNKGKDMVCSDI